jgi:LacI family transcriptional regulator
VREKVTIYDIAKKLGISAATVSRALNNSPKISEATKKLVLETAKQMNYEENKLAKALKSGRSNNVGVIVTHIDRSFLSTVIRGIEEALRPHGYQVIICQSYDDEEIEIGNINTLLNAQVDGILMSLTNSSDSFKSVVRRIREKGVPLVFFDRKKDYPGVSTVTINDFEGGYQSTKHLIEQGCKRIAHLAGELTVDIYKERFEGYKQALLDNGLPFIEEYIVCAKSKIDAGKEAVKSLLKLPSPPDAIFSSSDYVALGAIQELQDKGVLIPEDFCIAGFSNAQFTGFMELSITTVDQSPREMGKIAAQVFLEQIENGSTVQIEKKVVLAPKLLIRKSSLKKKPISNTKRV